MKNTDAKQNIIRNVLIITTLLGAGLVLAPLLAPPWSPLNCRHQEINIKTGQARYSRYIWYVCVHEEIADTPLSLALQGEEIDVADIKPWHLANTFSPGVHHSPHYRFHAALHQARQAGQIFEMTKASPEKKREIAETVLKLWQKHEDYFEAGDYLSDLEQKLWEKTSH